MLGASQSATTRALKAVSGLGFRTKNEARGFEGLKGIQVSSFSQQILSASCVHKFLYDSAH